MDQAAYRQFYAEEIRMVANLASPSVVEALAELPRDRFLPPGPWTIRGEGDFQGPSRQTPDADPRHVHHNIAVAIDAGRMLFNGAPSVVAMAIDQLRLSPGQRVLHLGTGLGYYSAILARCVGPSGRVLGIEVDEALARGTRENLRDVGWAEVRHGDGRDPLNESFDAILINAGVTHALPAWLDALSPGGRMVLPLTAAMGPAPIGKGPMVLLTRTDDPQRLTARVIGFVAIYSALGVRDDATNAVIAATLTKAPFAPVKSARLDEHDAGPSCWLHTGGFCVSLD